jgi:hypothetical protein
MSDLKFGKAVLSNASKTHIAISDKLMCGGKLIGPCSEVREWLSKPEMDKFVMENRGEIFDKARFCKKCLKQYDRI